MKKEQSVLSGRMTTALGRTYTQPFGFGAESSGTNTPPTCAITSPANDASFTAPATITLAANASDADGSVSKVEFFHGTTKN